MADDEENALSLKWEKAQDGRDTVSGFACSCSAENKQRLLELRQWAYDELSNKYNTVTAENFLTSFIYHLAGNYMADISDLPSDMWGAVITSTYPKAAKQFSTFIQCDNFEDGLALTLKAYKEYFKDERNEWAEDGKLPQETGSQK